MAGGIEAALIDHVSVAVRSIERATRFYEAVLGAIGHVKLVVRPRTVGFGTRYAEFWINLRPDMAPVAADSGSHVCLRARSVAEVENFHRIALAEGGTDDGKPGPRIYSKGRVYTAFIRDPDGNRIEALTILPSPDD
jgi:catechol 2,3-dioxygenase-like lactoylglutathione lyase family enzyme